MATLMSLTASLIKEKLLLPAEILPFVTHPLSRQNLLQLVAILI